MRRAAAAGGPAGALKLHTSDRLRSSVRGVAGAPSGTRKPRLRRRRCVAGATVPTKHQRRRLPAEPPIQRSGVQEEAFHDGCFRHLRARAPLRPHTHRAIASYITTGIMIPWYLGMVPTQYWYRGPVYACIHVCHQARRRSNSAAAPRPIWQAKFHKPLGSFLACIGAHEAHH